MTDEENKDNVLVHDLMCSLFMIAASSYRFDSVLLPFPLKYFDKISNVKDISKLRKVAAQIPSIPDVLNKKINLEAQDLYDWITKTPFKLIYHPKSKFNCIKELTKQELSTSAPDYVFEVIYPEDNELKFLNLKNGFKTFYAYHGSRIENFHSIIHYGLASHLNKNGLFGYGTYFSSELSVSLHYSTSWKSWEKSCLGSCLSCVAVCEIIDHPSVKSEKKSCPSEDKLGDKVPQKYYIVANNDLVRLRYLLIYSAGDSASKSRTNKWWYELKFPLLIMSYILLLIVVGLSNSPTAKRFISQLFS